jgi:hypothetical protein
MRVTGPACYRVRLRAVWASGDVAECDCYVWAPLGIERAVARVAVERYRRGVAFSFQRAPDGLKGRVQVQALQCVQVKGDGWGGPVPGARVYRWGFWSWFFSWLYTDFLVGNRVSVNVGGERRAVGVVHWVSEDRRCMSVRLPCGTEWGGPVSSLRPERAACVA